MKKNIFSVLFTLMLALGFSLVTLVSMATPAQAQNVDDYRSAASGNWNDRDTWERWNGSEWKKPTGAQGTPTSSSGVITIRNSHTVTVTAGVTVDQVVVEVGGAVTINSGRTWTIADGTGTDLIVNGTVTNAGTITLNTGATVAFQSGATYQHNRNGDTIPTATWHANSTCLVTGVTTTLPGGFNQTFGNLTWNCVSQTTTATLPNTLAVAGNLTIQSTGAGQFRFASGTSTVSGNYSQSGGSVRLAGVSNETLTVSGNFSMSGGTLEMADSSGVGTLNVAGNFSHTSGTIQESGSSYGAIFFNGTGTQTYTSGGTVSNTINFTVNSGSTLQMAAGSTTITGGGSFTLSSGAGIGITSPSGITSSGATGNIQVTGTRTFSTGANYIYNGTTAQVTGNGLPATVNNLTINNASGVTLTGSVTVNNTLTLTNGNITTEANTVTIDASGSVSHTAVSHTPVVISSATCRSML